MHKKPVSLKMINLSQFDINLLAIFCMVYDSGSISHVADLLEISPSAVSQSLSKLRSSFGDYLFIRKGRKLQPTVYSDELYNRIQRALAVIADIVPSGSALPERKTLVVYTSLSLSSVIIPPFYHCLLQENTDFGVQHIEVGLTDPLVRELLTQRQADMVFSPSLVEFSEVMCEKLFSTPLRLVCSDNNTLYSKTITIDEFLKADVVGYTAISDRMLHYRQIMEKKYHPRAKRLLTSSMSTFLTALASTQSIGFIPSCLLDSVTHHYGLRELESPFTLPDLNIFVSYRKELLEEPTVVRLLGKLKTVLNADRPSLSNF